MNAMQLKPGQVFRIKFPNGSLSTRKYLAGQKCGRYNIRVAIWDDQNKWVKHMVYLCDFDIVELVEV